MKTLSINIPDSLAAQISDVERFPEDFMFQITGEEAELLRCQTGISKPGRGAHYLLIRKRATNAPNAQ